VEEKQQNVTSIGDFDPDSSSLTVSTAIFAAFSIG